MIILKSLAAILSALVFLFSASGITTVFPHLAVIPDIVKVGIDYISLERNSSAVSKKELVKEIAAANKGLKHPFVLATPQDFDTVQKEYSENSFSEYSRGLFNSVISNANGLLDTEIYPVMPYELDEEDSILPISREVINRIVILGYAWQVTGEEKYAARAWQELENVCGYGDWCTGHFLATAEMALAASIGYDWLFDYLSDAQKALLAETTWEYAIEPALSKNYLKNWFTWSKNNWNSICYSGIGIACMTFSSYNPEKAAEFLAMCYANMPIAFENFTPDGVYAEGPGYCQSGMNAIVFFISSSQNYFGTDFGMSQIDGFRQLGFFPAYITTPTGVFNFGDNKARMCFSPVLHWYASEYASPLLAVYQMWDAPEEFSPDASDATERNGSGKEDALSSLWYNREYTAESRSFSNEPLAMHLESDAGQSLVLMRSAFLDKDATFAGIKGGYNYTNHGDLDIGTFVFDSMGERWAEELGPGNYDAPNYFVNLPAAGRWKNYCKRAEGQNTLVINPGYTIDDQYALAECGFTEFEETADGGRCVIDMTDAYRMNGAVKTEREFELYNGRTSLKITDSVKCIMPSEIYWFMHTKAD
ncbi:MAG: heparinase II/III family protein, partial [Clostridia bacterium]|nr:heparinase II/III family protein [Clostridia bacterium]